MTIHTELAIWLHFDFHRAALLSIEFASLSLCHLMSTWPLFKLPFDIASVLFSQAALLCPLD